MAFVVEDETGLPLANAYVTAAEVTAYLTDRGREAENGWNALDQPAQEQKIIMASQYADVRWGPKLKGVREFTNISDNNDGTVQGLEFPRKGLVTRDGQKAEGVPLQWKHAVMEYAVAAGALTTLFAIPSVDANGPIKSIREKSGDDESDITYASGSTPGGQWPVYPIADNLAKLYTGRGSQTVR